MGNLLASNLTIFNGSYGQMILFPWSHSARPGPDHFRHLNASLHMAAGIKSVNNISYVTGSVGGLLCKSGCTQEMTTLYLQWLESSNLLIGFGRRSCR